MPADVTLREITADDLGRILNLVVSPGQEQLVATTAKSIAQAHYYDDAWFRAVYAGDQAVGFLMLSLMPEKAEYFVWRMLIDGVHQRKGYGRRAMELAIEHVRALPDAKALFLSHVPLPGNAGPFYEKLGFAYTGETDESGELLMKLDL